MKGFDVLNIKSAVKTHNKFNLSRTHLTTADIGQIIPLFFEETVPGDKFNVKANFFSRMSPLAKPTYGKFYFKTASFFVPYIQLCDSFEGFAAGKTTWEGVTPSIRYISYKDFVTFLDDSAISSTVGSGNTEPAGYYDFSYTDSGGTKYYNKFTDKGRFFIKILNCLGYAIPQNINLQTSSSWYSSFGSASMSALPFLAFCKAYNDYMSQSQRYNGSLMTSILRKIKHDINDTTYYLSATHTLTPTCIKTLLNAIVLSYENDYFTSAWQSPNAPQGLTNESVQQTVAPNANGNVNVQLSNSQQNVSFPSSVSSISQRTLDYLKAFDNWVRRNNYSGSRAVQQIYSRFGIKTDDFRSNYAHVIGTSSAPVQVGDVTQTAANSYGDLGDYAGKGIMNSGDGFSFQASDYGAIIMVGYYTIAPMMSYGNFRHVLRTIPFDFYNPEFDGLGAEAISFGEVFCNPKAVSDTTLDNQVYGFTERYNSYRYSRDLITGDWRKYDSNAMENAWHTGRLLNNVRAAGDMVAQSSAMNTLPQNDSEYDRIFSVTAGVDNFFMTAQFDVTAVRPMLSLNQVPQLGEGDTKVAKNGNVIN